MSHESPRHQLHIVKLTNDQIELSFEKQHYHLCLYNNAQSTLERQKKNTLNIVKMIRLVYIRSDVTQYIN